MRKFLATAIEGINTDILDASLCPDSTVALIINKAIQSAKVGTSFVSSELPLLDPNIVVASLPPVVIDDSNTAYYNIAILKACFPDTREYVQD